MVSKFAPVSLALALGSLGFLSTTKAVDFDWNGSVDNAWLNAANWTSTAGTVPTGGDGNFARFIAGSTRAAAITADVPTIQDVLMGNNGTAGLRQIDHSAGTLILNGWLRTGNTGTGDGGVYNLSGGTLSAGSYRIAEVAGSTSVLNVSGGTLLQRDVADPANGDAWSRIGQDGVATVNLSGTGMISLDSRVLIGAGGSSAGTTINQTGGTFEVRRGEFTLGDTGTNARYNISAGTLRTLSTVDNDDTGGNITVGQWDNSNAKLTISGTAIVRAARDVNVADGRVEAPNTGVIEQTGGSFTYGRGFEMGRTTSGNATYTLSGGTLMQDTVDPENAINWNNIGTSGTAVFNLSGTGLASFNGRTHLGQAAGGNGTVNQTGGTFEVRNHELILGDTGTGTYNISAGTVRTMGGRPINVGHWNDSVGNLNVSGTGLVESGGDMNVGNGDTTVGVTAIARGTVTQTGGTVRIGTGGAGNLNIANDLEAVGVYNLQGGTLDLTGGNLNRGQGTATFSMTGGVLTGVGNIAGNSADSTFTQQGGTLEVGGVPGAGGASTINGNYSLGATGVLRLELSSASADQLTVNGTVTLGGQLNLQQTGALANGSSFIILANDGVDPVVGFFSNAPNGVPFSQGGNTYTVRYNAGDGNDIVLVPEPSAFLALVGGTTILALRRRRSA
jgi:hypothetical protein